MEIYNQLEAEYSLSKILKRKYLAPIMQQEGPSLNGQLVNGASAFFGSNDDLVISMDNFSESSPFCFVVTAPF